MAGYVAERVRQPVVLAHPQPKHRSDRVNHCCPPAALPAKGLDQRTAKAGGQPDLRTLGTGHSLDFDPSAVIAAGPNGHFVADQFMHVAVSIAEEYQWL